MGDDLLCSGNSRRQPAPHSAGGPTYQPQDCRHPSSSPRTSKATARAARRIGLNRTGHGERRSRNNILAVISRRASTLPSARPTVIRADIAHRTAKRVSEDTRERTGAAAKGAADDRPQRHARAAMTAVSAELARRTASVRTPRLQGRLWRRPTPAGATRRPPTAILCSKGPRAPGLR